MPHGKKKKKKKKKKRRKKDDKSSNPALCGARLKARKTTQNKVNTTNRRIKRRLKARWDHSKASNSNKIDPKKKFACRKIRRVQNPPKGGLT
mmetsp:Transcript_71182/g.200139  ORF Transcript_71182/g.200139 Transcript_71182/m.200139 type:complete len:92 (-) Transcript_71182:50-325(-)